MPISQDRMLKLVEAADGLVTMARTIHDLEREYYARLMGEANAVLAAIPEGPINKTIRNLQGYINIVKEILADYQGKLIDGATIVGHEKLHFQRVAQRNIRAQLYMQYKREGAVTPKATRGALTRPLRELPSLAEYMGEAEMDIEAEYRAKKTELAPQMPKPRAMPGGDVLDPNTGDIWHADGSLTRGRDGMKFSAEAMKKHREQTGQPSIPAIATTTAPSVSEISKAEQEQFGQKVEGPISDLETKPDGSLL